jgi:hypothetical protein
VGADEQVYAMLKELDAAAYPSGLPVNDKGEPTGNLPAVVFKQIGGGGAYSHDGMAAEVPLWEFRCWATTYAAARTLARQARVLLEQVGLQMTSMTDQPEPQSGLYWCAVTMDGYFPEEDA